MTTCSREDKDCNRCKSCSLLTVNENLERQGYILDRKYWKWVDEQLKKKEGKK